MHAAKTALGPVSVPQVLCALGAGLWLSEYVQLGFVYTYSISGASGDLRWLSIPLALPLALAVIFVLGRRHAPLSDRGGRAAAVLTMVVIACFVVNYPYSRDVYYASQYAEGMLLSWSLTFAMVFFGTFVAGEWLRLATRFMGGFRAWRRAGGAVRLACARPVLLHFPGPAHFALQTGSMLASAVLLFFVGKAQREGKGGQPGLSGHREAPRLDPVLEELSETYALSKREREVFWLLARGYRPKQIAADLYVSYATARSHINHIYGKMGVHSFDEFTAMVAQAKGAFYADGDGVCPGDGLPVPGGIALEAYRPPAWQEGAKPVFARCRGGRRTPPRFSD